jgi:hypothetical protein
VGADRRVGRRERERCQSARAQQPARESQGAPNSNPHRPQCSSYAVGP